MPEDRTGKTWSRTEALIAFRLYCALPFGRLDQRNEEVIDLARLLGRTPGSVAMKACNFASLDPVHRARGVKGLPNRGKVEEQVWQEFAADSESVADEAEAAYEALVGTASTDAAASAGATAGLSGRAFEQPEGPTDEPRIIRARRVQAFFRRAVLSGYGNRCALTGLRIPALLNASHIIPWAEADGRRADPTNGLCLNALHDRAFDRGLISFDDDLRMIVSPALRELDDVGELAAVLPRFEGRQLRCPERFAPDREALARHRDGLG